MNLLISKFGKFWRVITEDRRSGIVERLFVPNKVLEFIRHYLQERKP